MEFILLCCDKLKVIYILQSCCFLDCMRQCILHFLVSMTIFWQECTKFKTMWNVLKLYCSLQDLTNFYSPCVVYDANIIFTQEEHKLLIKGLK